MQTETIKKTLTSVLSFVLAFTIMVSCASSGLSCLALDVSAEEESALTGSSTEVDYEYNDEGYLILTEGVIYSSAEDAERLDFEFTPEESGLYIMRTLKSVEDTPNIEFFDYGFICHQSNTATIKFHGEAGVPMWGTISFAYPTETPFVVERIPDSEINYLGEAESTVINVAEQSIYYSFTPARTGYYTFSSVSDSDPRLSVITLLGSMYTDDEIGSDFYGYIYAEAGTTVYLDAYNYHDGFNPYQINVSYIGENPPEDMGDDDYDDDFDDGYYDLVLNLGETGVLPESTYYSVKLYASEGGLFTATFDADCRDMCEFYIDSFSKDIPDRFLVSNDDGTTTLYFSLGDEDQLVMDIGSLVDRDINITFDRYDDAQARTVEVGNTYETRNNEEICKIYLENEGYYQISSDYGEGNCVCDPILKLFAGYNMYYQDDSYMGRHFDFEYYSPGDEYIYIQLSKYDSGSCKYFFGVNYVGTESSTAAPCFDAEVDVTYDLPVQYRDHRFTFTAPEEGYYSFTTYSDYTYSTLEFYSFHDEYHTDDTYDSGSRTTLYLYEGEPADGIISIEQTNESPVTFTVNKASQPVGTYVSEEEGRYSGYTTVDGVCLRYFPCDSETVVIPETVAGYTVTEVYAEWTGNCEKVKAFEIPGTVNSFNAPSYFNNVEKVTVYGESGALKSVNGLLLKADNTEIEYVPPKYVGPLTITPELYVTFTMFNDDVTLTDIIIEDGVTNYKMVDGVVYSADMTTLYRATKNVAKDFTIPESVENITGFAFSGNETLEKVTLPETVSQVTYFSFVNCKNLASVSIPENLQEISDGAFYGCTSLKSFDLSGVTGIGNMAFMKSGLTSVEIPDGIEYWGSESFSGSKVSSVKLPEGEYYCVPAYAFKDCKKLTAIDFPSNIKNVYSQAFANTGIKKLRVENSVEYFNVAFSNCESLTEVYLGDGVGVIEGSFMNCKNLTKAFIGKDVQYLENAFLGCTKLTDVTFENGMNLSDYYCSGQYAFSETGLKEITLPESVAAISYGQFKNSKNLAKVNIGDSVTAVHAHSLDGTKWFNNQPDGDVYLDYILYAYKNSKAGASTWFYDATAGDYILDIKDGTRVIASCAYEDQSFFAIVIPESVKYINGSAFACDVTHVFYEGTQEQWNEIEIGYHNYALDGEIIFNASAPDITAVDVYGGDCINYGAKVYSCGHCGETHYLQDYTIAPTGHTFVKGVCEDCGALEKNFIESKHNYDDNKEISFTIECPADAETEIHFGKKFALADGDVFTIQQAGSDWVSTYTGHSLSGRSYSISGKTTLICTFKPNGDGVTDYGFVIEDIDTYYYEYECAHENTRALKDKAATCLHEGAYDRAVCVDCGQFVEIGILEGKLEHTVKTRQASKATCTESGYTEGTYCTVCGCGISSEEIPAKGHTSSGWIVKKATVNAAGKKYKECTDCGKVLEKIVLPQLKCAKPSISKIENKDYGARLEWKAVEGADSYKVYRKVSGGSYKLLGTTTKTAYADKTAKSGTKYYYVVKATNEAGDSEKSASKGITFLANPAISAIANKSTGVKISWGKVSGADSYKVYRKTSSGSYAYIGKTTSTSYTDKTAKSGTKYYYVVKAVKDSYVSVKSEAKSITFLSAPTIKTPTSAKSGITVKWSKVSGAEGYIVYRKTGSGSYEKLAKVKGGTKVSYLDKTAKKGKTYSYKIVAYKGSTKSAGSAVKTIKDKY